MQLIDLRSDTVTKPSAAMRQAMANAPVGDDVIDVDPTVDRLEKLIAELLNKQAAMFMPSGTMTNQIAVRLHCRPGDEFICEEGCHIYNYEQGAYAQLTGVACRPIIGDRGSLTRAHLEGKVRPLNEHLVRTRLLCLENTHNRAGGRILPYDEVAEATAWAGEHQLSTHLDGARLFNSVVSSGIAAADWAGHFDTISVCFSKGLGAPVGSALVGSRDALHEARWHRKCFGGGMRQAGIIAAGAVYALEHNIDRLVEDHEKAQRLADEIEAMDGLSLIGGSLDTNIIMFQIDDPRPNAGQEFVEAMEQEGVRALSLGPDSVRLVTHLDVSHEQIEQAVVALRRTVGQFAEQAS